jgi:hypothetical protein
MSNSSSSNNTTGPSVGSDPLATQSTVDAYQLLTRESRLSEPQTEYLTMLRYWFGTTMIDRYSRIRPKTEAELAEQRIRYESLSLDEVFNKSAALANLEIHDLLRGRVANLTPFATAVVERILDRQHPSAFLPLDRPTLRAYKPPTMFNGTEYSKEDCDRIHRDMCAEQIQDDVAETAAALIKAFKKLGSLSPESLAELKENCTREVEANFTLELALKRYQRTRG